MKDAMKCILGGFEDDHGRAMRDIAVVLVLCIMFAAFLLWNAAPIPTDIPIAGQPVMAEAARQAVR